MITGPSLAAYIVTVIVLTMTPGLDTAFLLRTVAAQGSRSGAFAAAGIASGCLCWGGIVAGGLGAVLAASRLAYDGLRWAGAAYLCYLAIRLWTSKRSPPDAMERPAAPFRGGSAYLRGFLTNMLNPKAGLFYVALLPQFVGKGADPVLATALLGAIGAVIAWAWFTLLVLATRPIMHLLRRPRVAAWLDRVTGSIFLAFGMKLALGRA